MSVSSCAGLTHNPEFRFAVEYPGLCGLRVTGDGVGLGLLWLVREIGRAKGCSVRPPFGIREQETEETPLLVTSAGFWRYACEDVMSLVKCRMPGKPRN